MNRTIIIGDIHGCYDEFQALLDAIAPSPNDRIIAIGDIVDRGPASEKVLEFFRDTPNAMSIMGNHERKHIRSARGEVRPALSQIIVRDQLGERYPGWLAFMETFPRHHELQEAILVHGFFEPGIALAQQLDNVVIGTLSGEKHMTDTYPGTWYDHYRGPKPLVFGHHDYLRNGEPLVIERLLYGIDTGAPHGGRLTALILPEFRVVQVPSRGDYWTAARTRYAAKTAAGRAEVELAWENLARFSAIASDQDEDPMVDAFAHRCRDLELRCGSTIKAVLDGVRALTAGIVRNLESAPDGSKADESQMMALFACRARSYKFAPLLFQSYRGRLNEDGVRRFATTPAKLEALAEQLGVPRE